MATIPFGEWLPDQPPFGLKGATVVTNVIPDEVSYRPFPKLTMFSNAIGSRCRGAVYATDTAHNNYNYVGDSTALYTLVQQSFTSVTRAVGGAYSMGTDDVWEFANWGNTVIGVNGFGDLPQQMSLGGTAFTNLSVGVKAKHIGVMRDFVVLGNVSDSATNVYRVRWSALNNPTDFTPSAATLSDYQDLPSEGGHIQKVLGGETGVIMQERSIWRMQFIGSPIIFQFDRVHNGIGAYIPQSCVRYQNLVFFLSRDGFYSFDGTTLDPIGRGKVDRFFFSELSLPNLARTVAAIDPGNKLAIWAYPSTSAVNGNPDKMLVYSWAFKRWVLIEGLDLDYLLQATTSGYTLDGLDSVSTNIDTMTTSFDNEQWTGGQIILAAFNSAHKMGLFNGAAMGAKIDTAEFQMFEGMKAMMTEIRPNVIGLSASLTLAVYNRNNLTESVSVGTAPIAPNATGFVPVRQTARYFRVRLQTTDGVDFTHLLGIDPNAVPAGNR